MEENGSVTSNKISFQKKGQAPLLGQHWSDERAYRTGCALARITVVITGIITILNIIYSGIVNIIADFILIFFASLSIYLTKRKEPVRHFVWWPLYLGYLIAIAPSLWLSGGVYSPWMGVYIACGLVITAVVQTRITPLKNLAILTAYLVFWLVLTYIFPLKGKDSYIFDLPPHFMALGFLLMNFAIGYGIYQLLKTEKVLSVEIERQYAELFETKANLLQEEAANQSKSDFLANISHELRTPLGSILGYAHLLQSSQATEEEKKLFAQTIERNGQQLAHLVDDLLDLSKVEAGRIELERIDCSLPSLISDVVHLLEVNAKKKGIEVPIKLLTPIPEMVYTDPYRFKQILTNIVGNALKFTEKGKVEISVSFNPIKSEVLLVVRDTGRGIAQKEREKLFKPFSQADASTTRHYGGTGLGLNFSRELARLLGGDLKLTWSERGVGSEFTAFLPVEVRSNVKMVSSIQVTDHQSLEAQVVNENFDFEGLKLLVVDDARENRDIVKRFLTPTGAKVDEASDGVEALQKVEQADYDLILMDIQMPGMDGLQATSMLRQRLYPGSILAISAHAMKHDRERSIEAGCDEHITKPLNKSELMQTIEKFRPVEV